MTAAASEVLEYPELLALVAGFAGCPLGRSAILSLNPSGDRAAVETRLALAAEAIQYRRALSGEESKSRSADALQLQPVSFGGIDDPVEILPRLAVEGAALEIPQILSLLRLLEAAAGIRRTLLTARRRFPQLARETESIGDFEPLAQKWSGKFLPSGELDDRASPQLQRLRQEIEKQRRVILSSLRHLLRSVSGDDSAQDEIITVRGDRFVVPLRAQKKGQLRGVVHGSSSSGQTLYVEPLETIELNNDLVRLREEEAREIHRILREITAAFHDRAGEIEQTVESLARLDAAFAAARFAGDYDCVIPVFNSGEATASLNLENARHPLLATVLRRQHAAVVPLSLALGGTQRDDTQRNDARILVISGPNTGGKTVAMKTVGLLALMALSGLPVPASRAELPFFEQVLADIGDAQSISENLSTFSSHLLNIKSMMESATSSSLILLDELGSATDPEEAGALAVAVTERFRALGVFAMVSTHHMALKAFAASNSGMFSGNMGFNEETLAPTYRLELGRPGNSSGLAIAQRLGLPAEVLARARTALSTAHHDVEHFLARLQDDSEAATRLRSELETRTAAQDQREKQWAETQLQREQERATAWERQLEQLSRDLEERAEQKLRELAEAASGNAQTLNPKKKAAQAAARFREQAQDDLRQTIVSHLGGGDTGSEATVAPALPKVSPRKANVGDTVNLRSLGRAGIVRGKSADSLEVEIGPLRTRVSFEDVEEVIPARPSAPAAAKLAIGGVGVRVRMESATRGSLSEINVIGETADEALRRVDKFLDNAFLAQLARVRVVHGHGKGILRRALAEMFSTHPHVEKHEPAPQNEGGTGATIVELKQ